MIPSTFRTTHYRNDLDCTHTVQGLTRCKDCIPVSSFYMVRSHCPVPASCPIPDVCTATALRSTHGRPVSAGPGLAHLTRSAHRPVLSSRASSPSTRGNPLHRSPQPATPVPVVLRPYHTVTTRPVPARPGLHTPHPIATTQTSALIHAHTACTYTYTYTY